MVVQCPDTSMTLLSSFWGILRHSTSEEPPQKWQRRNSKLILDGEASNSVFGAYSHHSMEEGHFRSLYVVYCSFTHNTQLRTIFEGWSIGELVNWMLYPIHWSISCFVLPSQSWTGHWNPSRFFFPIKTMTYPQIREDIPLMSRNINSTFVNVQIVNAVPFDS